MDPVGPWSAYASYNRLAQQASTTSNELHHHLATNAATVGAPATTTAQLLPGGFLSPPPVGYENVFSPLFHHAGAKPAAHYVTQHRQALAQAQAAAASKQTEGDYNHQAQAFFDQNPGAWQQNSPFGILPHESVVATTAGKSYENFNAHFAAQSINHLNNLAAVKNASRAQSPQVATTAAKVQPNPTFFQVPTTFSSSETAPNKSFPPSNAQQIQQSCIVTSSNSTTKEYRVPQAPTRAIFLTSANAGRMEKSFVPPSVVNKPSTPQIQTKAQTKIYPELSNQAERQRSEEQSQSSPVSFSVEGPVRLTYANTVNNNGNKRQFQTTNYRHYQPTSISEVEFQRTKEFNSTNGSDCNVVVPRRPSPLQAHSQASPIGHAPSPAYPMYNSPMQTTISSPQSSNQVTPPSPLDVSVPRPNSQTNVGVAYPSVITRTLNTDKQNFPERFERQNQNCWDERRKFNNNYNPGGTSNSIEIPSRQIDVPNRSEPPQRQAAALGISERQQAYFENSSHQVTLQDLSSCRGDPMSIVKNLQQQQSCQVQQPEIKQEIKTPSKRRKSNEKPPAPINEIPGRIPPPAHSSTANQPQQNGAYFDFDRWNLPAPPAKILTQNFQQHQGLMVPHPHSHHPPPSMPYFPPFLHPPHPTEFSPQVEISHYPNQPDQNHHNNYHHQQQQHQQQQQQQQQQPQQQDDQPKVVVPNIEEELNFLSEATPPSSTRPSPHIQQPKPFHPPMAAKPPETKPSGPGAGFMSSYLKFLQGERDTSPPPAARGGRKQTWSRSKPTPEIVKPPEVNGTLPVAPPPPVTPVPPPPPTPPVRLSQGDPQDDPRYFPLPKERKRNSFDSSDDGFSSEDDLFNKKMPPIPKEPPKEKLGRKGRPCKPGGPTERKRAKLLKKKDVAKEKEKVVEPNEPVAEVLPRREVSKRAAKEKINLKDLITKTADDEVEEPPEFMDSDSDPAWTPQAKVEGEEEPILKKGKRGKQGTRKRGMRNLISAAAQGAGIQDADGYANDSIALQQTKKQKASNKVVLKQGNAAPTLEDNIAANIVQQQNIGNNNGSLDDNPFKAGEFVAIKSELNQEWPAIWRVDGKTLLQKFEPFQQHNGTLYKNISTYTSWTPESKKLYVPVPVKYKIQNQSEIIVEFARSEMVITDPLYVEQLMKDSEVYQDNFEVYIQTLISQALDSNFLTEIFQEQDDYFLSNVKTIDDITHSKKFALNALLRWPPLVQESLHTWPCFNIIRELSQGDMMMKNCSACGIPGIAVRVLMYGQPYNHSTLEGTLPNPHHNEKDFVMCRICASRVELYNKITHQKYLMYIECAKKVAEKRTTDPHKDTTCILNELLADESWLNQLFTGVRNYWAEVDSMKLCLPRKKLKLSATGVVI